MKQDIFDKYADAIAERFHLSLEEIYSTKRTRDVLDARQTLYYLCLERPIRLSYLQRFLGENGCDLKHSTIINGYKRAKDLIDTDPDYKSIVDQLIHDHEI